MSKIIYKNDISGLENINEIYESSLIKKWIKLISIEEYNRKDHFILIANIYIWKKTRK